MSARSKASLGKKVQLPRGADDNFLGKVIEVLERLRAESELRSHTLLASLLEIAKGEAEDELKTSAEVLQFSPEPVKIRENGLDDDEGVLRMAEKLAWRGAPARKAS